MDTTEVLTKAKELISTPDKYCTTYFAMSEEGPENILSANACKFCSRGAVMKAQNNMNFDTMSVAEKILHKAAYEILNEEYPEEVEFWTIKNEYGLCMYSPDYPAAYINNVHGHTAAMKVFDRAIEMSGRADHGIFA